MKRVLMVILAGVWLLTPFSGFGQTRQSAPPPVAQPLVREGEFAFKLVDRLKMGSPGSEAEAESRLASAGIAPRNGWIADYPITPDIVGEIQTSIIQAADSGKLSLSRDEALVAFEGLIAELGLSVVADTRGEGFQNDPPAYYGEYSNPVIINNYYYVQGPPVVTYYPPPWDYYYLYAWVPYPFWYSGFWFSGFFILNDFHRPIYGYGGPCFVSNHYRDHWGHRVYTVDPVTRHKGRDFPGKSDLFHGRGFPSAEARRGATSIFERSRSGNIPNGNNATRSGGRSEVGYSANKRGNNPSVPNSRTSGSERPIATWRNRSETASRVSGERPSSQQGGFEGPLRPPSTRSNRSFSLPSGSVSSSSPSPALGRRSSSGSSFKAPSAEGGRSFITPSGIISRSSTPSSSGRRSSSGNTFGAPSVGGARSFSPPSGSVSGVSPPPSLGSRSFSGSSFRAPSVSGGGRSFTAPSMGSRGFSGGSFRGF